jgi:hypothetical protein
MTAGMLIMRSAWDRHVGHFWRVGAEKLSVFS